MVFKILIRINLEVHIPQHGQFIIIENVSVLFLNYLLIKYSEHHIVNSHNRKKIHTRRLKWYFHLKVTF